MLIQTTRFGRLHVDHSELILMPHGLIGFETCRHWILLQHQQGGRVAWLQSVGLANVAVPVVSPRRFAPDYRVHVSARQLTQLHLRPEDQVYVLAVVSKKWAHPHRKSQESAFAECFTQPRGTGCLLR